MNVFTFQIGETSRYGPKTVIIDESDRKAVMAERWFIEYKKEATLPDGTIKPERFYARNGDGIYLHRFILGLNKSNTTVRHKNGNGLDNTRGNLISEKRVE